MTNTQKYIYIFLPPQSVKAVSMATLEQLNEGLLVVQQWCWPEVSPGLRPRRVWAHYWVYCMCVCVSAGCSSDTHRHGYHYLHQDDHPGHPEPVQLRGGGEPERSQGSPGPLQGGGRTQRRTYSSARLSTSRPRLKGPVDSTMREG